MVGKASPATDYCGGVVVEVSVVSCALVGIVIEVGCVVGVVRLWCALLWLSFSRTLRRRGRITGIVIGKNSSQRRKFHRSQQIR